MTNRKQLTFLEVQPGCYIAGPLEWVEGSEQKLVGESRSDGPASDAEKRSGERRGVGEIVERDELLRYIERREREVRREANAAVRNKSVKGFEMACGKEAELATLREWLSGISEERSDLSNAERTRGAKNQ